MTDRPRQESDQGSHDQLLVFTDVTTPCVVARHALRVAMIDP